MVETFFNFGADDSRQQIVITCYVYRLLDSDHLSNFSYSHRRRKSNIYFVQWLKQNRRCFCLISSCFIRTATETWRSDMCLRDCIRLARLHSCKSSIICCTHCSYISKIMPTSYAWLAQLGERRSAERKVAGLKPGRTKSQGL